MDQRGTIAPITVNQRVRSIAMPTQSFSPSPLEATASSKSEWPVDIVALAIVTGGLWAITFAWHIFDFDRLLDPPIHSEADAWLFALSGIIFIFLLLGWVVSWWGAILGIPTCLFVINLGLRRIPTKQRWFIAVAFTTALFVVFNHYGVARSPATSQDAEKTAMQSTAGQASEEPSDRATYIAATKGEIDAMRRAVDAKCAVSKDPDLLAACARFREAQRWESQ